MNEKNVLRWYEKHDFCKSVKCDCLRENEKDPTRQYCSADTCTKTAREFHHWLINNGFSLVKVNVEVAHIRNNLTTSTG